MPSLITPTQVQAFIKTPLSTTVLQQIIDAEEQVIVERFGAHVLVVEQFEDDSPGDRLFTNRGIASVQEIKETVVYRVGLYQWGETETILSANDYEIWADLKSVRRLTTGDHERYGWGQRVKITYVPNDTTATRILVLLNLCKINIQFSGLDREMVGGREYQAEMASYAQKRREVLNLLNSSHRSLS